MSTPLASLRDRPYPQLWALFEWITTIPRPSGEERAFRDHLINRAVSRGWAVRCDAVGNLVLAIDGRGDLQDEPPLILQGHLDMVCEKNADVELDFFTDPIPAYVDGDWIRSKGTTLGADNGVAVALGLAAAEADLEHRVPLELLFTIEEETGLVGATELDPDILTGKRLINLDSEEDGIVTIGCAGGIDLTATFDRDPEGPEHAETIEILVSGLRGGHSGVDIHQNRGNAIAAAATLALRMRNRCEGLQLVDFSGGSKRNAIPRESRLLFAVCELSVAEEEAQRIQEELRLNEPDARVVVAQSGPARGNLGFSVIEFVQGCPIGVIRMDPVMPDLVRTSNSIGVVNTSETASVVIAAGRSSSERELDGLSESFSAFVAEAGGRFSSNNRYPGWLPNRDAQITADVSNAWKASLGETPELAAIHAGLEAGLIGERIGSDQVISLGPTIENAHSPDEQLNIASMERIYRFLEYMVTSK